MCVGGKMNRLDLPNSNNQIIVCKSQFIVKLLAKKCQEKSDREHALATSHKNI